jgi:hypothetical protein
VIVVREKSPWGGGGPSHKKTKPNATLGRRKGSTPVGYLGQTALWREQCDMMPEYAVREAL